MTCPGHGVARLRCGLFLAHGVPPRSVIPEDHWVRFRLVLSHVASRRRVLLVHSVRLVRVGIQPHGVTGPYVASRAIWFRVGGCAVCAWCRIRISWPWGPLRVYDPLCPGVEHRANSDLWSIVTSRIECPRDERGISYQPWKSGVRRHFVSRFPAPTARYCKRRKGSILYLSPFAMSDVLGDSLSSSCRRSALP